MQVKFKRLRPDAILPQYMSDGAAGMDLSAALDADYVVLKPGERVLVPTGLAVVIPRGFEGQVRPRSGLATMGITVFNAPGTIDSDYRGEVQVLLVNLGDRIRYIASGARIAQLVIAPVERAEFVEVVELDETDRGTCGFGSTGVGV